MTPEPGRQDTPAQRRLARLSFVLAALAVVILVVFAGLKSSDMLALGLAGAVVSLTAAFFFLSRRGVLRWLSLTLFVLTRSRKLMMKGKGKLLTLPGVVLLRSSRDGTWPGEA